MCELWEVYTLGRSSGSVENAKDVHAVDFVEVFSSQVDGAIHDGDTSFVTKHMSSCV